MTSVRKHITKSVIDSMKPDEIIWDTRLMGFGARYQHRDKVFVYKCRIGNRQRWFAIGKYGQPWTVAEAENRVKVIQGDIAKDLDPAAIRDERNNTESVFALAAIRLLIFTGCRRNEILKVQWKDVKIEQAIFLLPETRAWPRPIYHSASALPVLARLHGVRIHDLRHSFASVGVNGGASLPIIGKLLGYEKNSTTEKYAHAAADPVRAVNDAMGLQIAAMLRGNKGNVSKLRSAA